MKKIIIPLMIIFIFFSIIVVGSGIRKLTADSDIINNFNLTSENSVLVTTQNNKQVNISMYAMVLDTKTNIDSYIIWDFKKNINSYKFYSNFSIPDNAPGDTIANGLREIVFNISSTENIEISGNGFKYLDSNKEISDFVIENQYIDYGFSDILDSFNITLTIEESGDNILLRFNFTDVNVTAGMVIYLDPIINVRQETGFVFGEVNSTQDFNYIHAELEDYVVLYMPFDFEDTASNPDVFHDLSFDHNGDDQSSNTNTVKGLYNNASNFDGVDDEIEISHDSDLDPYSHNFTVSFWVNTTADTTSSWVGKTQAGQTIGWRVFKSADEFVRFHTYRQSGTLDSCDGTSGDVTLHEWQHIVAIINDTTKRVYVNGVETQTCFYNQDTNTTQPFQIGLLGTAQDFAGQIDELIILNKSLTPSEVTNLYNNQSTFYKKEAKPFFSVVNISQNGTFYGINVTTNTTQTLSSIKLRLWEWNGTQYNDSFNGDLNSNEGIVAWWHLDKINGKENATHIFDWSNNDNNGTANGDAKQYSTGVYQSSYYFDGTGDYIDFGDVGDVEGIDTLTVSVWFEHDGGTLGGTTQICVICKGYPQLSAPQIETDDSFVFYIGQSTISFKILNSSNNGEGTGYGNFDENDNKKYHAVGIYNGSDISLYLNGDLKASASFSGNIQNSKNHLFLSSNDTAHDFNGMIDEVIIWNRSLSNEEVEDLYIKGRLLYDGQTIWENVTDGLNQNTGVFNISGNTEYVALEFNLTSTSHVLPYIHDDITVTSFLGYPPSAPAPSDTVYPYFYNYGINETNGSTYSLNKLYEFYVNVTNTNGTVGLWLNGTNYTATNDSAVGREYYYNDDIKLPVGVFNYYWYSYGNGTDNNYNKSLTRYYTVSQADGSTEIWLNNQTNNVTVELGDTFTYNVSRMSGEVNLNVYLDGVLSAVGVNTANTSTANSLTSINITAILPSSQNYTKNTSTRWIDVQDTTPPTVSTLFPTRTNYTYVITAFNYSASDLDLQNCWYSTDNGASNTTSLTCANITGLNSGEGTSVWTVWANDTSGNEANSSVTFFVDSLTPNITNIIETPTDPPTYSDGATYEFNATIVDTNLQTVIIEFDGTNYTLDNPIGSVYNLTLKNLAGGTYNYYFRANDTLNNVNITSGTYTINKASGNVTLLINGTNENQTTPYGTPTNASASTPYGLLTLFRNGVDVNSENHNLVTLGAGDYNYTSISAGNENYSSIALTRWAHISRANSVVGLTLNNSDSNVSITVGGSILLNGTLTTGDSTASLRLYNNLTLINVGSTEVSNTTTFSTAGTYNITVVYQQSANYSQSSKTWYVIVTSAPDTENPSITSLAESPTDPATYSDNGKYEFNATITDNIGIDNVTIEFDGTNYSATKIGNIFNFTIRNLSVGTYNYLWYVNDTSGNVNTSSGTYTINKATGSITLLLNDSAQNQTAVYGTQTNASATTPYGTVTLLRDGVNVDSENSAFRTLGVGDYNYTANSSGNTNYNPAIISRYVHISRANSVVQLTLNSTASNISIDQYQIILLNGTLTTGDSTATLRLYRDGSLINTGSTEVSNSTNFTTQGLFNITVVYQQSANYSQSSKTYWVNVSSVADNTKPYFSPTPADQNLTYNTPLNYDINASDNVGISYYTVNESAFKISSTGLLENNTFLTVGIYYLNISVNDTSNNINSTVIYVNITKANSTIYTYLNHARANSSINNGTSIYLNASLITGNGEIYLYNNHSLINNGTSPISNLTLFNVTGTYNITSIYRGNENYSASSETFYVVVTRETVTEEAQRIGGSTFRGLYIPYTIHPLLIILTILIIGLILSYFGATMRDIRKDMDKHSKRISRRMKHVP